MTEDATPSPERPGFQESLRVLRRRWRMAVLVLVASVGVSIAYSLSSAPVYVAAADVLIDPSGADLQTTSGSKVSPEEVATQTQVVTSLPVARLVQMRLSLAEPPDLGKWVTVQPVGTSRILRITAQDGSPEGAAETANTVASAYLQFREQDSVARYEEARNRLLQEQSDLQNRMREINDLLAGAPRKTAPSLQMERRTLLTSLAQVSTQIDDLSDSLTTSAAGGELLDPASPADQPIAPQTALNAVLAALAGAVLGIGAALLRDRFDDVVHDEEVGRTALDAVVVARVPQWPDRHLRGRLVTLLEPHAPASEEYQRLAVNVRFMLAANSRAHGPVVLVTSGSEGEGKTVTACNLAVAAARMGLEVVLVDADFRRASVGACFGLGDPPGLSDVLVGEDDPLVHMVPVGVPNLQVLPAGTLPPNPAALLSSAGTRSVLSDLSAQVDLIIVDSPPVLTGADSLELAGLADMVLVVVREGVSRRRQLTAVRETLRQVGIRSVGVLYNSTADTARSSYTYTARSRDVEPRPEAAVRSGDPHVCQTNVDEAPVDDETPRSTAPQHRRAGHPGVREGEGTPLRRSPRRRRLPPRPSGPAGPVEEESPEDDASSPVAAVGARSDGRRARESAPLDVPADEPPEGPSEEPFEADSYQAPSPHQLRRDTGPQPPPPASGWGRG